MSRVMLRGLLALAVAAVLAMAWWGWHEGGLALMQLGMGVC